MPKVMVKGKIKHFPYTKMGMAKAKKAKKKLAWQYLIRGYSI